MVFNSMSSSEVTGSVIPAKTFVALCPYIAHMDESVFPDPSKFNPDRFSKLDTEALGPNWFLAFGGGAHLWY